MEKNNIFKSHKKEIFAFPMLFAKYNNSKTREAFLLD